MASNWYVYSGAGGAGTGADWANAVTTLAAGLALGGYAAGDTFYLAHDHAETGTAAFTLTFKGTPTNPDRVICVNRSGSVPPVSADLRTTATITTTGTTGPPNITVGAAGQGAYVEGVTVSVGSGVTNAAIVVIANFLYFKNCALNKLGTSSNTGAILITQGTNATTGNSLTLDNTTVRFGATADQMNLRGFDFLWKNTPSAIQGATIPTALFSAASSTGLGVVRLDGVDLSALGANKLTSAPAASTRFQVVNCKLGTSAAVGNTPTASRWSRLEVLNSDSGATGYRQEVYDYAANLTTETTIVRSGGASDGVQAISHKIVTNANAKALVTFDSFPIAIWNTTTGAAKTLTVEMVNDGTTLQTTDIWIDVEYLGSTLTPVASVVSSGPADSLAAGSNYATSSATWTTTGLGAPVKQAMSVTFTPQMAGYVRVAVKVAKASKTIYVDPKVAIT